MHATTLPITGPCPIDLDAIGFDRTARVAHCSHCVKSVTILSNMTRGEATEFLREHKGQKLCVSYARDAEGRIRFRPEPKPEPVPEPVLIPVSRLRARPSRRAGLVAALGVSAALAACTPHGEPPRSTPTPTVVAKPEPTKPTVVDPIPEVPPTAGVAMIPEEMVEGEMEVPEPEEMVEGKMEVPDPTEMVDGEMAVPDLDAQGEPCDKGKTVAQSR